MRNVYLDLVLDPETLEVRWHAADPFIHQHDPDFIGEGWTGLFDNNQDETERGSMLGGRRIVAMQPHTDSIEVLFQASGAEPFYTPAMGKWQRLENGNLLLTESQAGRVVEVTGEPVAPVPRRVLVVDDQEDVADSLAALLETLGQQVEVAYTGIGLLKD